MWRRTAKIVQAGMPVFQGTGSSGMSSAIQESDRDPAAARGMSALLAGKSDKIRYNQI